MTQLSVPPLAQSPPLHPHFLSPAPSPSAILSLDIAIPYEQKATAFLLVQLLISAGSGITLF